MSNFVVIFTNENYVGAGLGVDARVTVPVDFGVEVTSVNLEEYVDQLVDLAVELWDNDHDVDWASDEPGWEAVTVELPSGEVVDL